MFLLSLTSCHISNATEALPGAIGAAFSKNNSCTLSCQAVEAITTALAKNNKLDLVRMEQSKVSVFGVRQLCIALQTNIKGNYP